MDENPELFLWWPNGVELEQSSDLEYFIGLFASQKYLLTGNTTKRTLVETTKGKGHFLVIMKKMRTLAENPKSPSTSNLLFRRIHLMILLIRMEKMRGHLHQGINVYMLVQSHCDLLLKNIHVGYLDWLTWKANFWSISFDWYCSLSLRCYHFTISLLTENNFNIHAVFPFFFLYLETLPFSLARPNQFFFFYYVFFNGLSSVILLFG